MNTYAMIYYFFAFWLICSQLLAAPAGQSESDELLTVSKYWPKQVAVQREVLGQTHGNQVPPGRHWEFIRYEHGKCLVDMGHNGIFAFNPEDTDLLERVRKNQRDRTFPYRGLFTFRYTKSFFNPETNRGYQLGGDLEQYEYFILFYFNYDAVDIPASAIGDLVKNEKGKLNRNYNAEILLVPDLSVSDQGNLENYLAEGFVAPTVIPFMRDGLMHSLHHKPQEKGGVVVLDKFGQIKGQFFLKDLGQDLSGQNIFNALKGILGK
ncbi:hypothetical protein DDZ13_10730 [Coraliomargarita sinensis]|uniref:Thioredoxin domain-containing protein n=1 Tax=Coraliomargarita sinensis TaxID=2174842 RepID=A0A317ZJ05_9BACT|nr:hypothetical protein [Coraliomargarita sinensis]PXA03759.1 hypothetical protein DDZ13_10730 [Coraliomargarita sinensis]